MLSVGKPFPKFSLTACVGRLKQSSFETITPNSFPSRWLVYFFWPKDFTPVCATEVAAFCNLVPQFEERQAQIVGVSTDSEYVHMAWCFSAEGCDVLPFPLVSDIRRDLSTALGILDDCEGVAQRATFIVDPGGTIRHASVNDFSVGRNPRELLRIIDALQTDDLCPSSWEKGQPTVPDEDRLYPITLALCVERETTATYHRYAPHTFQSTDAVKEDPKWP